MSDVTDPVAGGSTISLPKGGGAQNGLGETFAPDLFTGTGNFSVPIALPQGRCGLAPQLSLMYSTGSGNGPFGLGWRLDLPGVTRKTSHGLPRYVDAPDRGEPPDVFVLSGAEDLVPVGVAGGRVRYRPRTEGLFARIEHVRDGKGDYWEVRSKNGMLSRYGTPTPAAAGPGWVDPAVLGDPDASRPGRIFAWRITETRDPMGNVVRYEYRADRGAEPGHLWNQPLLSRIAYVDYGQPDDPRFLVVVELDYEQRPDAFSDRRAGFEVRTTLRCTTIRIATHAADGVTRVARDYRLGYEQADFNQASLLTRIDVIGIDDQNGSPRREALAPLTFGYSAFDPARRRFEPLKGPALPTGALDEPSMALVDLGANGLPDIVELGATKRYWTNQGEGRFDRPRQMVDAPAQRLGDPGVGFIDADGDGRADLLVTTAPLAGYYPLTSSKGWDRRSFQPYRVLPSVDVGDPSVKLVDLDGDGLSDVLRSASRLQCWFNDRDPELAWRRAATGELPGPAIDLSDPRVRLADMTGDGLQDIVLVHNGNIAYWPSLGYGRFGPKVQMRGAPRLPGDHDPRRVLLGDVDGDGLADLLYVDRGRVQVWANRAGEAWSEEPVSVTGTPDVADTDSVRIADLYGTGMGGVLWSRAANGAGQSYLRFLDLAGGHKPYLLDVIDNHRGALTAVEYQPSTVFFLEDQRSPATRWRTTLPFPVHVVARVVVNDRISLGTLTTRYRYRHGYWDGVERELRGFARVEQLDAESFARGEEPPVHYSPPTLTRTWFHVGPVSDGAGDWTELDLSDEYWPGDEQMLQRPAGVDQFLAGLPRRARRDALRSLRGQMLRSELFALDLTAREDRPFTVTESVFGVREESAPPLDPPARPRIFFSFPLAQRSTQWERGDDPMTSVSFSDGYDAYGFATQKVAVAVPRGRDPRRAAASPAEPYLATYASTEYARRDDGELYVVDRVARQTRYEVLNDGRASAVDLRGQVLAGAVALRVIGHDRTYYDGDAYVGLPLGQLGDFGLPVRAESLMFTDDHLDELFDRSDPLGAPTRPPYLDAGGAPVWTADYPDEFRTLVPPLAGHVHYDVDDVPGSPGGFYSSVARHRYDVQSQGPAAGAPGRGLLVSELDALGAESTIEYDVHDLLPARITDPAGLEVRASHDLRVLQARELTDQNGNTTMVTFSPLGLVTSQYVRGKNGEGDAALAGTTMEYDLLAFDERAQPVSVRSTQRAYHDTQTDVAAEHRDDTIVAVQYSDGFGRLLQTRARAEDVIFGDPSFGTDVIPIDQAEVPGASVGRTRQPSGPDNVIVSGWQTYDNKGRIVEKYEPQFATGWDFTPPDDGQPGQRSTVFYDSRGRMVHTVNADGSEERVVLGTPPDLADPGSYVPSPWVSYSYDANDNAGRTHGDTSRGDRSHWDTPASTEVDALGRAVVAVARNGPDPATDSYVTRSTYDIQGNVVAVIDPLGREAFRFRHDLGKRRWRMDSIDAGRRDSVPDALGRAVEVRDGRGALTLTAFDVLQRPIRQWARDGSERPVTLRQRIAYGDGGDPAQPGADREAARQHNLLGRTITHHDGAGLVTIHDVDFKGNALDKTRRVVADAAMLTAFDDGPANGWQIDAFRVDWQPAPDDRLADREAAVLEATAYRTTCTVDALNRLQRLELPEDAAGRRRALVPGYSRAGALERLLLDDVIYIERIAYDARGRRSLVAYGNEVMTRYAYDPRTCRLRRLRSERYSRPDDRTYQPDGPVLQDLGYDFDPVGNIVGITDRAPGSGIPDNPEAFGVADAALGKLLISGDALERRFAYDPLYRLVSATGREADTPGDPAPWADPPRPGDLTRCRPYTEQYRYDTADNLVQLDHKGGSTNFTRELSVDTAGNGIHRATVGGTAYTYLTDVNGNLVAESTSRHFEWDHADRLNVFRTQTDGAEPSVHAQYLYDASGRRVKKLVRTQGGQVDVTHYLDPVFEHHRWSSPSQAGQNWHVHVTDGTACIARVRSGDAPPGERRPEVQFVLADHLGSHHLVLDETGDVVVREEFTPYGETSFGGAPRKRYRFTGKERDEESGLSYHEARYYHPALARWVSCDPLGLAAGVNLYIYGLNNPLCFLDGSGLEPEKYVIDADGTRIPTEVIEIKGTDPFLSRYPDLHSAVNRGLSEVASWQRYKSRILSDLGDLRSYSAWIKGAGVLWQGVDADDAHAEYERELTAKVDREYDRYLAGEAAKLASNYRQIDAAANVVDDIAVVPIAVPAIVAGGEILVPLVTSLSESSAAYSIGTTIYNTPQLLFAGTVAYGLVAPPGAPDLPGPGDDVGRAVRGTGYKIIDGVHRSRAAVQLGIQQLKAEVYAGDKLVETIMVNVADLRSTKAVLDLSGKGLYRWMRALEEVASGASGPIKINTAPGGVPIHSVRIVKPRE